MSQEIKKPVKALQFLNKKGQGIVEFALVLAFCVGIGMAAREAGLAEALDAAFAGTSDVAAPKDIEPGVSKGSTGSTTTVTIDQSNKTPERTDAKYASMTSDEVKDFNFLNDLKTYFESHPTGNNIDDDIWNAYKGNQTFDNDKAEASARSVGLALLDKGLTGDNAIEDAVWKDLKAEKNWAFDQDDKAIYDFLNSNSSMSADELRLRNVYLSELDSDTIATLRSNSNNSRFDNENIYSSYLAIKKKFWPDPVNLTLAPVISNPAFNATSDEMRIFNYVAGVSGTKGLVSYFEQYADRFENVEARLAKELAVYKLNNVYSKNDDSVNPAEAMFGVQNIEDIDNAFWVQIKGNNNWVRDEDDEKIKAFLGQFVTDFEADPDKENKDMVEELQNRNVQFKNLGTTAEVKTTIQKMINKCNNEKFDVTDTGEYEGYLAIKKQFWKENKPVALQLTDPSSSSNVTTISQGDINIQVPFVTVTDDDVFRDVVKERGEIFQYNNKYYILMTYDIYNMNKDRLSDPQHAIALDSVSIYTSEHINTSNPGYIHYDYMEAGSIVMTGDNDSEAWVVLISGGYHTPPFNITSGDAGKKIGTKVN